MKLISVIMVLLCIGFGNAGLKNGTIGADAYFISICIMVSSLLIGSMLKNEKREKDD